MELLTKEQKIEAIQYVMNNLTEHKYMCIAFLEWGNINAQESIFSAFRLLPELEKYMPHNRISIKDNLDRSRAWWDKEWQCPRMKVLNMIWKELKGIDISEEFEAYKKSHYYTNYSK